MPDAIAHPDLAMGETRIILADLPAIGTQDPGRAVIVAAVAGTEAGWKRAALSHIEGERVADIGQSRAPAIIGQLLTPLAAHTAQLEDRDNRPIIRLLHAGMTLPTGTGNMKSFDAPAIWIAGTGGMGDEIIRYAQAEKIGALEYRLSGLVRGETGAAAGNSHAVGADIFLIEEASLTVIDSVPTPVGASLAIEALGTGDASPVGATILIAGNAIVPRSPVHGTCETLPSGDLVIGWKRRDRVNYEWTDAADMPNSEGGQEFAAALHYNGGVVANWAVSGSQLSVSAAERAAFGLPGGAAVGFYIRQQGRFALSAPLIISATL